MDAKQAIELVVALASVEDRATNARALAQASGAEDLLVFLHDTEADALLPAPGWRKTLPGGAAWRRFLASARGDGLHRGDLPWLGATRPVLGCAAQGLAIVFIGGQVSDADAGLVRSMAPRRPR
jgi:hypothetical protein